MFKRRFRHRVPTLNTTSTADISFMLLIFFLVTTSIDNDYGLTRRLAPLPHNDEQRETVVKERDVLTVALGEGDRLTCNGAEVTPAELEQRVEDFVENASNSADMPERHSRDIPLLGKCAVTDRHVIAIAVDRQATYDAYFALQNAVMGAYKRLRDRLAGERFGRTYAECTPEQQAAVAAYYPQRISETTPDGEGGDR